MTTGQRKITIAIDGYSSCGKSTLAQALAKRLQYLHIDSGAMYRAVTLYFIQNKVDIYNEEDVALALEKISIHLGFNDDVQVTWLNGVNVDLMIREPEINQFVSHVSTLSSVRKELVARQRKLGANKGLVMDGRDIGTVVFPEAELKLFLTADIEVRVERRWLELTNKGIETTREEVRDNLLRRDHIDSTRVDSPLRKANDATVIDTSYLTQKEQLQISFDLARSVISTPGLDY
ncbi:MAG: (d)CMP kinase [Saprospiraceae bacterium]|uniref:Cytidylate kinase n=1 Tax=Candidatus Opimibacter skivensis TaxID=2982028 RepID=A0A9D7SYG6_9BACT|nr:(d)CMP kinase [Candidatus Opimibacter skivensis]